MRLDFPLEFDSASVLVVGADGSPTGEAVASTAPAIDGKADAPNARAVEVDPAEMALSDSALTVSGSHRGSAEAGPVRTAVVDAVSPGAAAATAKTRQHLAAIERLANSPEVLFKHRLIGPDASFSIQRAAKVAQVPVSSGYREPIMSRLRALADVPVPETFTSEDAGPETGSGPGWLPQIDHAETELWLTAPAAREAGLTADDLVLALDDLKAWDKDLEGTTDRVPSYGRRPAKGVIARDRQLHPHILDHPSIHAVLLELARRHGVTSARGGRSNKADTHGPAISSVTDRMNSLALREESFPADASGLPLLGELLEDLGLSPELAYRHRFRLHVAECQRTLLGQNALPSGEALSIALAHAAIDLYEKEVDAGTKVPPLSIQGILRLESIERKLNLVVGMSRRHPGVGDRLQGIADRYIQGLSDKRAAERQAQRVAHIVASIKRLGTKMMLSGEKAAVNSSGGVSMQALSVAMRLQFGDNSDHPLVLAALDAFVEKVGLREKRQPPHPPKSQQDLDVDDYCRLIKNRGFGPPRARLCVTGSSVEGAAEELGIDPKTLTANQNDRIRTASRALRKLNPKVVESEPLPYELNLPDRTDLLEKLLADPIFDAGLPGHPLDGRKLDWGTLGTTLGMGALFLRQSRPARILIDAKMLKVGIAPHPGDRSGITFGDLRTFGRRRRVQQAQAQATRSDSTRDEAEVVAPSEPATSTDATRADVQPASIAARTVRALETFLRRKGLAFTDAIGLTLLKATPDDGIDAAELTKWRLFHAELAIEQASHPFDLPFGAAKWGWRKMPLASALALLCRAKGASRTEMSQKFGGRQVDNWLDGTAIPRWTDEVLLSRLNDYFDMAPGTLGGLLNGDRRALGVVPGERTRRTAISCHLPFNFVSLDKAQRAAALRRAQGRAVQNTKFSKRSRVLIRDEYILRFKNWPAPLKAEWAIFEARRRKKGKQPDGPLDIFDTIGPKYQQAGRPVANPTGLKELGTFERFFGFLHLAVEPSDKPLLPPLTRPDELDFHRENLLAVDYRPRGGLGMPKALLTMAAVTVPGLVRAFIAFAHNRSDGYSRGTISEVKNLVAATKPNSSLRQDASVESAQASLRTWLDAEERSSGCPGYERETADLRQVTWEEAAETYTLLYKNLWELLGESAGPHRDKVPDELIVEKKRISFDPVMVVLTSETPAAIYRMTLQEMIRNQPPGALQMHMHLRNCLIAMILFQTYLRIKNIAQLTYKDDQSGQLRKVGGSWFVKIHRKRFKNAGGAYFRHGHFFTMRLRDEDGLYGMIDAYLRFSREYLRSLKPKPTKAEQRARVAALASNGAAADDEGGEFVPDAAAEFGEENENLLSASDDEDGDSFEDADGDGEPDDARFFVKSGGRQYLPSQLAAQYKAITNRYLCESPDRQRGLTGLMPHGPHAVRHVGATDALAREGSWEAAARVIQDSIRAVQESYVLFTPDRQGRLAGASMERGRASRPKLPDGVVLLGRAPAAADTPVNQTRG